MYVLMEIASGSYCLSSVGKPLEGKMREEPLIWDCGVLGHFCSKPAFLISTWAILKGKFKGILISEHH
jgi:hypothetical protein